MNTVKRKIKQRRDSYKEEARLLEDIIVSAENEQHKKRLQTILAYVEQDIAHAERVLKRG